MKLQIVKKSLLACAVTLLVAGCQAENPSVDSKNSLAGQSNRVSENANGTSSNLTIATWNLEHLAYPAEAGCRPRTSEEMAKLKAYANTINADIVAMQEVHSAQAVHQIFPASDWQVVMSGRADNEPFECRSNGNISTQQKVAFAVKKGLEIQNVDSKAEFALNSRGLRHALEISVNSDLGPMSLLNVHMKSGCFVPDYAKSDKRSCQTYAQQAPILDEYVETKELGNTPYVILGDFNHRLAEPGNAMASLLEQNSNGSVSTLQNTTKSLKGCHQYYPVPIDHILMGKVPQTVAKQSADVHHYQDMEPKRMLSDHCAVTLTLSAN
ncbi:endonuclease/exonuclease/phosphatase family protein [Psychrosphaera ytuae]|uniref:Endonuclease/exonuclease/phosphatase family protein n=1 Tax=Psychrosphaera ytuae TaxID=2820710 RepID=A0A975DCT0_9GAMM|nr:endonuclease/exonuclease/phosphatase family protein [Psychrosphaera ytuae]QTH64579.1 endonuclease/exonuclease/phosphatase family protein [Psychrosphaera ytuae]